MMKPRDTVCIPTMFHEGACRLFRVQLGKEAAQEKQERDVLVVYDIKGEMDKQGERERERERGGAILCLC